MNCMDGREYSTTLGLPKSVQAVDGITNAVMPDMPSEGFPPDSNVHYSVQTPRIRF